MWRAKRRLVFSTTVHALRGRRKKGGYTKSAVVFAIYDPQ
jgi:hypothetical protein